MTTRSWKVGDWAVYRKQKRSAAPGPRAEAIDADAHGEKYTYIVEKFWVVEAVTPEKQLQLITRTGKRHLISSQDPRLRAPSWWERLLFSHRFRSVEQALRTESQ